MTARKIDLNPVGMLAFLMGQASLLLGVVFATVYWLAFALLAPHAGRAGVHAWTLPSELPLAGLGLGVVGLFLARKGFRPATGSLVAGIVLNGLALVLAAALGAGR